MSQEVKKCGLVLSQNKKKRPNAVLAPTTEFNIDDDEEDKPDAATLFARTGAHKFSKRKVEEEQANVLSENPTAFSYDEVYDNLKQESRDLHQQQEEEVVKAKPARYIQKILERSQVRELDLQRAFDKKYKKEVDKDADLYADKMSFVTSGYKSHLQKLKTYEEQVKKKEEAETINSVEKKGMDAFHVNWNRIATGTSEEEKNRLPKKSDNKKALVEEDKIYGSPIKSERNREKEEEGEEEKVGNTKEEEEEEGEKEERQDNNDKEEKVKNNTEKEMTKEEKEKAEAIIREQKIAAARERLKARKAGN